MNYESTTKKKISAIVGTGVLAAIIIVLQTLAGSISVGPFTITLSIVPIIIGAVLYGPKSGTILGAVFGLIVVAAVISGTDVGGAMMFQQNPIVTVILCILKSTLAGFAAGMVASKFAKKSKLNFGVMLASILAPICNTGIFILGASIFFLDLLKSWAGSQDVIIYIFAGLVGVNFLIELAVGIILVPVVVHIIRAIRRR